MAVYDYVPPEKMARRKKNVVSKRQRSQLPGHPASDPMSLTEKSPTKSTKLDKAVSNSLDTKNKATKVAGKGTHRDSIAQGARKAGTPSPKPNGTDKKVRGQAKK